MTKLLTYGLHPTPLILNLICAVCATILEFNLIIWLLGILLYALMIPTTANYFFTSLLRTADGNDEPALLSYDLLMNFGSGRYVKFIILLLVAGFYGQYLWQQSNLYVALSYSILLVWLLPAITLTLALDNRWFIAFNPLKQVDIAKALGLGYWGVIVAAFAFIFFAYQSFQASTFVGTFLSVYLGLTWFVLLGKLAFNRRNYLGITATFSPEVEHDEMMAKLIKARKIIAQRMYREAKAVEAMKMLEEYLATAELEDELDAHLWFRARIQDWHKPMHLIKHGFLYAKALEQAGQHSMAKQLRYESQQAELEYRKQHF